MGCNLRDSVLTFPSLRPVLAVAALVVGAGRVLAQDTPPDPRERKVDGITFLRTDLDFRVLGSVERPAAETAVVVRMDADAPPRERHGHVLLQGVRFWDLVGSPLLLVPGQELVLRVVIDERDLPGTLTVSVGERVVEPVELATRPAGYPGKVFMEYRYRPPAGEPAEVQVTFVNRRSATDNEATVGGLTVKLPNPNVSRNVRFLVGVSTNLASFESSFGLFGVYRQSTRRGALALRTPLMSLGRSTKLSLDAVTVYNGSDDIGIGGALTYSTLAGSRYYHSSRGVFGFPLKMNVTLGLEGLQVGPSTQNRALGTKAFFGVGFSIPTSEIKTGG
ncbi:MAG: hypothetical protein KIS66_04745 [Fimbriimonadaceae bacterium]|nr:hypothetical protein [Fimbriimonadaceae bacterium]